MLSTFLGVRIFDLEACGACNLSCSFCPRDLLPPTGNMSLETFRSFLHGVKLGSTDTVSFVGIGEPLLNRNIFEFIRMSKKMFPAAQTWITSNGTLLNRYSVPRLIEAGLDTLDVSFNGLNKAEYEAKMKGAIFERVLENIAYTAQEMNQPGVKSNLQINFIIDEQNKHEEEQIKAYWRSRGIRRFRVQHLHDRAGSAQIQEPLMADQPGLRCNSCAIFKLVTFVTWTGDVMYCCHDIPRKHKIANVNQNDWTEIHKRKIEIERTQNWPSICGSCTDPLRHNMHKKIDQVIYKEIYKKASEAVRSTAASIKRAVV